MTADTRLLLLAVGVQVLLTFALVIWMAFARGRDIKAGLDPQSIALGERKWSPRAQQIANAFSNQFELPVLFYVVAILFIVVTRPGIVAVVLAWLFVITRLIHAAIHTGSNVVERRAAVYGLGFLALVAMWIYLFVLVFTAPG